MRMVQKQTVESVEEDFIDDGNNSDSDYKDDEPGVPAAPMLVKDEIQIAFDEIINLARNNKLNLGAKDKREQFLIAYSKILTARTQAEDQTLLHIIANTLGHKSLTRCMVRKFPELLDARDESKKTPLYIAVSKKNLDFIAVVAKEVKDLDRLLRMPCEHGRNVIHAAIYYSLREEETIELVKNASEATLCSQDQDGLTPLHLAVEYDRCDEPQLRIVQTLIAQGDRALDEFTSKPWDLSVYQYHQYKRNRALRQMAETNAARGSEASRGGDKGNESGIANISKSAVKGKRDPEGPSDRQEAETKAGDRVSQKLPNVTGFLHGRRVSVHAPSPVAGGGEQDWTKAGAANGVASERHKHPNTVPIQVPPEFGAPEGFRLEHRATGAPKGNRKEEDSGRRLEEERIRAEYADKIREEVKLYYLRTTFKAWQVKNHRDQHSAIRFLHGENIGSTATPFVQLMGIRLTYVVRREPFL